MASVSLTTLCPMTVPTRAGPPPIRPRRRSRPQLYIGAIPLPQLIVEITQYTIGLMRTQITATTRNSAVATFADGLPPRR